MVLSYLVIFWYCRLCTCQTLDTHLFLTYFISLLYCLYNPFNFPLAGQRIAWSKVEKPSITVHVISSYIFVTETSDCNSFFRTDLSVQIIIIPLSLNIDDGTGTGLCVKSITISTSHAVACKPITLV